jgi:hypothetical protein
MQARVAALLVVAPLSGAAASAHALTVYPQKIPPSHERLLTASGTFPQVSGSGFELSRVNSTVRNAVVDDERSFAARVRSSGADPRAQPGVYRMTPYRRLMSASSSVVSALIPIIRILPGLNGGAEWFSVTVDASTGRPVRLRDLFSVPSQGLRVLASAARSELFQLRPCIRESAPYTRRGFEPRFSNYRYFALLPHGLAIGFSVGEVADIPCGRAIATVPYAVLSRSLSPLGRTLIAGVRTQSG